MKYLIVAILCILGLSYASYYLYMFDKKDGIDKSIPVPVSSDQIDIPKIKKPPISHFFPFTESDQIDVPEHLTKEFWENVTPEQLKEKLKNIKNVNEVRPDKKRNMLHLLVRYGQYPEMVNLLIDAGVDYNLKDINKAGKPSTTALHYAVIKPKKAYEFTKELLKYDINIDTTGGMYVSSPLSWAASNRSDVEVIRLLLEKGADPNFQNAEKVEKGGKPSLLSASVLLLASMPVPYLIKESFIDPEAIQLLLNYKADITLKNKEGKTAWDYMKENEEFIKTELFKKLSTRFQ